MVQGEQLLLQTYLSYDPQVLQEVALIYFFSPFSIALSLLILDCEYWLAILNAVQCFYYL